MPLFQLHPDHPELFPPTRLALDSPPGLLAVGGDLRPARLLAAYRQGVFPWFSAGEPLLWWSPPQRCVLLPAEFHLSRRLARWLRQCCWEIVADVDFEAVVAGCAGPRRDQDGTWIGPEMQAAYARLHQAGHAHSVEVRQQGELLGGLYGVALGGVFFAESMYSAQPQASKVALLALSRQWQRWGGRLIDAQLPTPHLASLGARSLPRDHFERLLAEALACPQAPPNWRTCWHYRHAAVLQQSA